MNVSRRELIIYLRNLLASAGVYPLLASPARGQEVVLPNDKHFFIFVELLGGAHHLLATNYPDPDALKRIAVKYPQAVMKFKFGKVVGDGGRVYKSFLEDDELSDYHAALKDLKNETKLSGDARKYDNDIYRPFGYFTALPYTSSHKDSFVRSTANPEQRLGPAALPLANYMNEISVVRAVYMQGSFHGFANKELYSGSDQNKGRHIAEVIAEHTSDTYPLPYLYMSMASKGSKSRIGKSWTSLARSAIRQDTAAMLPLIKKLANGMGKDFQLSSRQQAILEQYKKAISATSTVSQKLHSIFTTTEGDSELSLASRASRKLTTQLDLCLKLFSSNLSQAITIGVGKDNDNGFFDTHGYNLYHEVENSHFHLLQRSMQELADSIEMLRTTPYPNNPTKKWSDVVTLVVSSDFGRPPNFTGGTGGYEEGTPGNGHFFPNNNYILFGKNVAKGVWLGHSDPITHFPHVVDFAALNRGEFKQAYHDPLTAACQAPNKLPEFKESFAGDTTYDDSNENPTVNVPHKKHNTQQRTFMAKDMVKTIAAIAGIDDDKFKEYYKDEHYQDAHTIKPLLSK